MSISDEARISIRYERALREVRARVTTAANWINPVETLQYVVTIIDEALGDTE